MTLTFANPSEAREIAVMANAIWHDCFKGIISLDQINYMIIKFQSAKAITQQMESGYQYGFIFDGSAKAGYFALVPEEDSLFMSKLYLKKEFRGKGLGSDALQEMLSIGRNLGKKRVYLRVNVGNAAAIKTYEKNGFVRQHNEKTDIGNGFIMDDYVYQCLL